MTEVYLAIGSNVGDRKLNIEHAIEFLSKKIANIKSAPLYISRAYGFTEQDDFLNTAVSGETNLSAEQLLEFVKSVEQKVGRTKTFRWGPREIDIDIIFYGNEIVDSEDLKIPHQEFAKRDFVLKPLADLVPDFVDPLSNMSVRQILEQIPETEHSISSRL